MLPAVDVTWLDIPNVFVVIDLVPPVVCLVTGADELAVDVPFDNPTCVTEFKTVEAIVDCDVEVDVVVAVVVLVLVEVVVCSK